jgi:hypothetical protein
MRVQIQLRIVTDDETVLSEDVIACFDKGDDQLEEIGLSLDDAFSLRWVAPVLSSSRKSQRLDPQSSSHWGDAIGTAASLG